MTNSSFDLGPVSWHNLILHFGGFFVSNLDLSVTYKDFMLGLPFMIYFISAEWLNNRSFSLIQTTWRSSQRKWFHTFRMLTNGVRILLYARQAVKGATDENINSTCYPSGKEVQAHLEENSLPFMWCTLQQFHAVHPKYYNGSFGKVHLKACLDGFLRVIDQSWQCDHRKRLVPETSSGSHPSPALRISLDVNSERLLFKAALHWWFGL